ncbi:MAG: hypothetical protein AAFY56_01275 [Pseudomonadota bacterium]
MNRPGRDLLTVTQERPEQVTCRDATVWLEQLGRLVIAIRRDCRKNCELSLAEYRLLALIENESMMQKTIACDLGLSPGAVSRLVEPLRRMGCVAVGHADANRTRSIVSITRRGRNHLKRIRAYFSSRYSVLCADLSDADLRLLERVENNMRQFEKLGSRLL